MHTITLFAFLYVLITSALGATYYVRDADGVDQAGTYGTVTKPFKTLQYAEGLVKPGDFVYVYNGTYIDPNRANYPAGAYSYFVIFSKSGNATHYITYSAVPGNRPLFYSEAYNTFQIQNASFIVINGFEFLYRNDTSNPQNPGAGNCIVAQENSHHIIVTNNLIRNFDGAGVGGVHSDRITIENNTIYGGCRGSFYEASAISLFQNQNINLPTDPTTGYHNIIRNNFVYNNTNIVPAYNSGKVTDGNCIIIDDSRNTQDGGTVPYNGSTLVENNVCFNNGGRGIHAFFSDNVDVFNNVVYMNDQNTLVEGLGELSAYNSSNLTYYNNIVYCNYGGIGNNFDSTVKNLKVGNNIYYNSCSINVQDSTDLVNTDPQFVNPSILPSVADFHLKSTSPAIGRGRSTGLSGDTDFSGNVRPTGSRWDAGAYQYQGIVATSAPTPKPTPAPTVKPTPSPTPTRSYIYTDALVSPWTDWSFSNPRNLSDATYVHSGTHSFSWTPTSYLGAFFDAVGALNTNTQLGIELYVYVLPTTNQDIYVTLKINLNDPAILPKNPISYYNTGGAALTASTWNRLYIPFSIFPAGIYDGVAFQELSGTASSALIYFDDVSVLL